VEPLGHVDFYPAGGAHQPGCEEFCVINACTDPSIIIDFLKGGCSHQRANEYFAESINGGVTFAAKRCDTYEDFAGGNCASGATANMGFHLDVGDVAEGTYFLDVNEESPFARG